MQQRLLKYESKPVFVPDEYLATYSGPCNKEWFSLMGIERERYKESLPDPLLVSFFYRVPNLDTSPYFKNNSKIRKYLVDHTCVMCNDHHELRGWEGLCNRGCYYDLSELNDKYENATDNAPPDPRLVTYFSRYPEPMHSFAEPKRIRQYLEDHTCVWCDKIHEDNGWIGLCDRTCYHGLFELHVNYESATDNALPDPRLVTYFSRYPEPAHSFAEPKRIREYLEKTDALRARIYEERPTAFIC
jgi:hypothetical protein